MLYYFMIELLRNPEDLKALTGSMHDYRIQMYRTSQENEKKERNLQISNK